MSPREGRNRRALRSGGQRDSAESEGSGGGRCAPQEATPESAKVRCRGGAGANAFVFQEGVAGGPAELAEVKSLDELRDGETIHKSALLAEWRKILKVNYWPIFDIARRILEVIPVYAATLQADSGYTGVLTHNPMGAAHGPGFVTNWLHRDPYTLPQLAEVIPFGWRKPTVTVTAIGRNCSMFDALRRWAGEPENRGNDVLAAAMSINEAGQTLDERNPETTRKAPTTATLRTPCRRRHAPVLATRRGARTQG